MNKTKSITTLINEKGFVCDMCNVDLSNSTNYTLDHVIPKCFGGSDTIENLEILCFQCNIRRRNRIGTKHFYIHMKKISEIVTDKIKPKVLSYERRHGFISDEDIEEMIEYKNNFIEQLESKFSEIEKLKNEPIEKLGRVGSDIGKQKFLTSDFPLSYEEYKSQK